MPNPIVLIAAAALFLTATTAAKASDVAIDQVNKTFSQPTVTLKKGDRLTFKNTDDVTHNITIMDADENSNDKGLQKPGETIEETFTAPGTYTARCQIHPKMKMQITVQ